MDTVLIDIDYEEFGKDASYKGVVLKVGPQGQKQEERFFTGDVVKDWEDAMDKCREYHFKGYHVMYLSSVDHFVMDVDGYRWTNDEMIVRE